MSRVIVDANGEIQIVPDEGDAEQAPWLNAVGPSGVPRITVQPSRPVSPQGIDVPIQSPVPEPTPEELAKLILDQEGDSGQTSPLRQGVATASEGVDKTPTDDIGALDDVFERAASRVREGARPSRGMRLEGPFTEAVSNPVTMAKAAFDVTPPGALLNAADQYQRGNTGNAALTALGAIPGMSFPARAAADIGGTLTSRVGGDTGLILSASAAEPFAKPKNVQPRLSQTVAQPVRIESIGGPTTISNAELSTIGGLAAVSLGMAFAPKVFSKLKLGRVSALNPRPVREAVPGTVAISKPGDLARTYDDANAGAMRILRRAGVSTSAADEVWKTMRIQTRATANALTDSAVNVGRMESTAFTFATRVPLAQLVRLETPQVSQYLHVMDTIDDIKQLSLGQRSGRPTAQTRVNAGPITVRGMTLADAWALKQSLEQAHPEVAEISKAYKDNLKSMRRFETTGEYATLSTKDARFQNAQRSNYVPFGGARVFGEPAERGSAIESLAKEMRVRLRNRLQNEAVGKYVDEARRAQSDLFKPVTSEQLKDNPNWRKNVIEFKRRGNVERYTTDPLLADVLRMDPYAMQSLPGQIVYTTKRLMEVGTTGELAPWFAVTSMIRSWQIGKLTAERGMKSPTALGTMAAIPQQVLPQLANRIAPMLDAASGGWLGNVFGQGNVQALGQRLAVAYGRSLFAQLQTVGGGRGSILQQQVSANNRLTDAISHASGPFKELLEGYRALLNSVHNAPAFNYARRNRGRVALPELAMRARHMTGDPRVGGEFFTKATGSDRPAPIRFENDQSRLSQTLGKVTKGYGLATEFGRGWIPWYNATIQGVKRIGEAYLADPAQFMMRAWLYQGLPAASTYFGARALGTDSNGRSYVDYMMNGRSEYNKMMNFYIPVPGRPAEDGIEMPGFHEMTYLKHLMEVGLDHAFRSSIFKESEDFWRATTGFLGIVAEPPLPPSGNILLASQGMMGPQGVFTGEAFRKKSDPFDQLGGLPPSIELYARALMPGVADVVGTGYAAYSQTPKGLLASIANGLGATSRRLVEKTAIVRDVFNLHAPVSGNNAITEELFKKNRAIRNLESYFKTWETQGGQIGAKPRSAGGEAVATEKLGERPPAQAAGLNQPPPTNPLYELFAQQVHQKFAQDNPSTRKGESTGAIGFLSLWNRYGIATRQLERIKKVNEGNNVTWQDQLAGREDQVGYLKKNGVNPTSIHEVRNFYERQRQDVARVLLFTIRSVEDQFSKQLGRPIKIEDINPYGKGLDDVPEALDAAPSEF